MAVPYNLHYLLEAGGLRLDVGAARIIIACLIIASIGGLVGYGLGQVRFEPHSLWYLPGIVLLAAILIGIYEWLSDEAIRQSLGYTPWISVLIAAVLGAVLFAVINLLLTGRTIRGMLTRRTANAAGPDAAAAGAGATVETRLPATPYGQPYRVSVTDLLVVVGGILLLILGWTLQRNHALRIETVTVAGIHVAYPEGWLPLPSLPPAIAQWTDNQASGATLTLYAIPAAGETDAIVLGSPNPAAAQPAYTPLRTEEALVGDTPAVRADYAYARQVVAQSTPPEIVRGREISWRENGEPLALVLEAPESEWARVEPLFNPIAEAVAADNGGDS